MRIVIRAAIREPVPACWDDLADQTLDHNPPDEWEFLEDG